jgi:hypothetical protein
LTLPPEWLAAFPLRPATDAVEALCESWRSLSSKYRPAFNPTTREPELTRVLKAHVEYVTGRKRGLLGMWSTEGVVNKVNFETGEVIEERRTDITYGWNDENIGIQLVFEFKKLNRHARSRSHYLGENGLMRFVTGIYGKQQPVAAMVGILIEPFGSIVPPLRDALGDVTFREHLRLREKTDGRFYDRPSRLFAAADFDTEHERMADDGTSEGPIRVAHCFLGFAYELPKAAPIRRK